ncbi:DUF6455 family protein [Acidimangrovimonas sediminis]|uniref:DUF6455 family protein n=1 Tax=Acidimangrovimonas sediminis TaxID=2056283 RepID=UPI0011AFBC86|nr:DUF6455 family protein [Acidimangrovimonas sediminis]
MGSPVERGYWMTQGMARVAGVNLTQALLDGWLDRAELETMVGRCGACRRCEACTAWLARAVPTVAPPEFCGNRGGLERLRGQ